MNMASNNKVSETITARKKVEVRNNRDAGVSLELQWARSRDNGNYRSDNQLEYEWNEDRYYWRALKGSDSQKAAWQWLISAAPDKATQSRAAGCAASALLHLPHIPELQSSSANAIVPTRSGYVVVDEVGNVTVHRPSRDHGLRYSIDCFYDPEADAPLFHEFLDSVLPDIDVRDVVQEFIGYTLTGSARYQIAQVWNGKGRNGKGTLVEIISALHHSVASVRLDALSGFGLQSLVGASLCVVDETPKRGVDEQLLKSLISGDFVSIDRKYKDPLIYRSTAKWLLCGNHTLKTSDASDGYWRRWQFVPFTVQIPESEIIPGLAEKIIETEMPGVLRWAIDGLIRLQRRGRLTPHAELPEAMRRAKAEARFSTDSVAAWAEERQPKVLDGQAQPKQAVYGDYRDWCSAHGSRPVGDSEFWTRLKSIIDGEIKCQRPRIRGKRISTCNVVFD
ncbi:MAG: phage/plasmid primase, P4 family [Candidatus Thiodiazotropha sp.]